MKQWLANAGASVSHPRLRPAALRHLFPALFLALLLAGLAVIADAQTGCYDQCQQGLAQCLQAAGGNQLEEARCQDRFDDCIEGCLIH